MRLKMVMKKIELALKKSSRQLLIAMMMKIMKSQGKLR